MRYGNYLGNKYNKYPLEPIDELDYCCFLHDIDHKLSGGNNRYADRELNKRLKLVDFSKLSIKGKVFYILARYIYSGFYAYIIRELYIFDRLLVKYNFGHTEYIEQREWNNSYYARLRAYANKPIEWKEWNIKGFY